LQNDDFFLNFYNKILLTPIFKNLLIVKTLNETTIFTKFYRLFFKFKKGRFFVTLTNFNKKKNYLFLSTGMFIQYFQYKKSLRKNKVFNKGRYSRNRQNYRTGVY